MSIRVLSLFVSLMLCTAVSARAQSFETAYPFDAVRGYGNTYGSRIPAALVPAVVKALSTRNRDALLIRLLPKDLVRIIDGDTWFDLRGITIQKQWVSKSPMYLKHLVLDYAHFENVDMTGIDCIGCILRGVVFLGGQVEGADFRNALLDDSRFIEMNMEGTRFQGASFGDSAKFVGCKLDYSRFDSYVGRTIFQFANTSLRNAVFDRSQMADGKFLSADLRGARFDSADLRRTDFYEVIVDSETGFDNANLSKAAFAATRITSPIRLVGSDISYASLGDLDLSKVDMTYLVFDEDKLYLGEELLGDLDPRSTKTDPNAREYKRRKYEQAETLYRTMGSKFQQSSALAEFAWCRYRAMECRRKLIQATRSDDAGELCVLWLFRTVDKYGTSPSRLSFCFAALIVVFAVLYRMAARFNGGTWIIVEGDRTMTAPVGVGSGSGVGAAPVRDPFPQRRGWLHAVLLSLDATFAAIERIVGVPDVVSIVFGTVQRPRLKGNCIRAFYGLQAFLGFFFLVLLVRMAILFFGR